MPDPTMTDKTTPDVTDERAGMPASVDDMPTSFGVFKPVGHVMIGVLGTELADALAEALLADAQPPEAVLRFTPRETLAELQAMADDPGSLAGFGYEITLQRRYVTHSLKGYRWLLVKVRDADHAAAVAEVARRNGAIMAVYYRLLVVEDLI